MTFQYLCKHKRLPEFERFLAIEPVDQIVAPMYRDCDMLPKWFATFEELQSSARLLPRVQQNRRNVPATPDQVVKVPFDPKNVDNTRTVRSMLTESADIATAAIMSIIPQDLPYMLSSTENVTVSQNSVSIVNNLPSIDASLQSHTINADAPATAAPCEVLIITAEQLHQLGLSASVLTEITTGNHNSIDTSYPHCGDPVVPDDGSVSFTCVNSPDVPASVDPIPQQAQTAVTTSPNLIGRAFASAVGISVEQLKSFDDVKADNDECNLPPPTSGHVTASVAYMPAEVKCSTSSDYVQVSEQSVTVSAPIMSVSSAGFVASSEDSSLTTGPEDRNIFMRCDDVSVLDITMLNSSLSPLPSQPCDSHIDDDSTLATPNKMNYKHDDDTVRHAPVSSADIRASDYAAVLPGDSGGSAATDGQCPVSVNSEVRLTGSSSVLSGSSVPEVCTTAVGADAAISATSVASNISFINSVPVQSPAHGMALVSSTCFPLSTISDIDTIEPAFVVPLASCIPLPAGTLPSSPPKRMKQIPMHHTRSPLKRRPANQRPILPRSDQFVFPGKSVSPFLPQPQSKKSAANVHTKALPAIAPKAIVTKSYLSPVKQAAASITARAKRLQNSPSRNAWYSTPRLKTVESQSCFVRPVVESTVNTTRNVQTSASGDADEEVSKEDEEQGTDVDSQVEDEYEEELTAATAEQSPSLYVHFLSYLHANHNHIISIAPITGRPWVHYKYIGKIQLSNVKH